MVEQKPPLECFVSCDNVAMVICVFTQTCGGGRMIVKKLCKIGATLRETGAALYELSKSYRSRGRVIRMYAPSAMWERRSDSGFAPIDVVSAYFGPKEGRIHRMYSDDEEWFGAYIEKIINEHESTTMVPPYVYINERVPWYDSGMPEYCKHEIQEFLLKTGCSEKFVESIDDNFCRAFGVTVRAISRDLTRVYGGAE